MSDRLVFVLHDASEERVATELVAALAPVAAFPARLTEGVQFGFGALCVVLWTPEMHAHGAAAALAAAIPSTGAVLVRVRRAQFAPELDDARFTRVDGDGEIAILAARVKAAIEERVRAHAEEGRRRVPGGAGGGAPQKLGPPPARKKLAVRSAVGLAATMAIAGAIAPIVSPRAATGGAREGEGGPNIGPDSAAAVEVTPAALAPEPAPTPSAPVMHDQRMEPASPARFASAIDLSSVPAPVALLGAGEESMALDIPEDAHQKPAPPADDIVKGAAKGGEDMADSRSGA